MCLMPGQSQMLIPPTGKGSILAHYLRLVILLQLLCCALEFCTAQYVSAVFDLLGTLIGFMALRKKEGFVFQQVLCYTMLCAVRFVASIVVTALGFSQSDLGLAGLAPWQFWLTVGEWALQPFVFASGAALGWLLHTELRKVIQEMTAALGGDNSQAPAGGLFGLGGAGGGGMASGGGGGADRGEAASEASSGSYQAPLLRGSGGASSSSAAAAAEAQPGFRPFAGQGHRLGGS